MSVIEAISIPMILFTVIVAPLWLILHYLARRKEAKVLAVDEQETLESMMASIERMEDRVGTLEKILDAENSSWRARASASP
jgi:phage shock protein B